LRFHTAEYVIQDIKNLTENYSVETIFFHDDNFVCNRERLKKICEGLSDLDTTWACRSRTDIINLEILKMMKKAGCRQISFGIESGSQKILNVLNKRNTVENNKRAITLCSEAGIMCCGTFMIGNPTETEEDIRMTQEFIKENKLTASGISLTTPFPATALFNMCKEIKE